MNEELRTFFERCIDTATELETLENTGAIHGNFTLCNSILRLLIQLAYTQAAEVRGAVNCNLTVDDLKTRVWIRQRRIFNKLTAMAEIIPLSFTNVHDVLSKCATRTLACGGQYRSVDSRLFDFNDVAPTVKCVKRQKFDDDKLFVERSITESSNQYAGF